MEEDEWMNEWTLVKFIEELGDKKAEKKATRLTTDNTATHEKLIGKWETGATNICICIY